MSSLGFIQHVALFSVVGMFYQHSTETFCQIVLPSTIMHFSFSNSHSSNFFFAFQQSSANKFSLMHSHLHFRRKCKFSSYYWCECIKAFTPIVFLFLFIYFSSIFFRRFSPINYSFILCAISTILVPKCSPCSGHSCYYIL